MAGARSLMRSTGTVTFFNRARGFGYIIADDCRNVFFNNSQWLEDDEPRRHERVTFMEGVACKVQPTALRVSRLKQNASP
jgi:cold shock CspA family protein